MTFTNLLSKSAKLTLATLMAVSSLLVITITPAFAAVKTWTGTAGDNKFSTANNWNGNAVPQNGDSLTFSNASLVADKILTNDMTGLSLVGLSFTGTSNNNSFKITGNPLTVSGTISAVNVSVAKGGTIDTDLILSGDITLSGNLYLGNDSTQRTITTQGHGIMIGSGDYCTVTVASALSGSGSLTANGYAMFGTASPNYTGGVTINNNGGITYATTSVVGQTSLITVNNGGYVYLGLDGADRTMNTPLKLAGPDALMVTVKKASNHCGGASEAPPQKKTLTLAGSLELTGDAKYYGYYADLKITGTYTSNGHSFSIVTSSTGNISLPDGQVVAPVVENISKDQNLPNESVEASTNTVVNVSGIYGGASVSDRGTIKGTGTVKSLSVDQGGTVAPGNSPGKLTVLESLTLSAGATYEVELQNKDNYDQLQVGTTVDITGAKLDLKLFEGYKINKGDKFTVINKTGAGTITGTFAGLAEGATIAIGTASFSISYVGGDGNDVVLTALTDAAAPATPKTGFAFIQNNPIITLGIVALAAGFILILARKQAAPVRSSRKK